jgi:hypothetical protein
MHWKMKATIQNAVSLLPDSASYTMYYWIQRHFGGLRKMDFASKLMAGIETWKLIKNFGYDPTGKVFLEIGTGRVPVVPLTYWLMGAKNTITIDLNPYLKTELIRESLQYISANKEKIDELFGSFLFKERLNDLLSFHRDAQITATKFLDLCCIDYIAPGDAAKTELSARSIDFHTSYTVFEHIPPEILRKIIKEGNRIINDNGLFIHRIDYSDHFTYSDKRISTINFLQYPDNKWEKYARNRYMYMNRLRHDDFISMFQSMGHRILAADVDVDQQSYELIRSEILQLDERFKNKSKEVLSIIGSWMVSQKSDSYEAADKW